MECSSPSLVRKQSLLQILKYIRLPPLHFPFPFPNYKMNVILIHPGGRVSMNMKIHPLTAVHSCRPLPPPCWGWLHSPLPPKRRMNAMRRMFPVGQSRGNRVLTGSVITINFSSTPPTAMFWACGGVQRPFTQTG